MISKEEENFMETWESELQQPEPPWRILVTGVPAGLIMGTLLIGLLSSGWYERANMQMVKFNPWLLMLAILGITIFFAWMYRRFRKEMMEQRYEELKARKAAMQRKLENDGLSAGKTK